MLQKMVVKQGDDRYELNPQNGRDTHDLARGVAGVRKGPNLRPTETDVRTNVDSPTDL